MCHQNSKYCAGTASVWKYFSFLLSPALPLNVPGPWNTQGCFLILYFSKHLQGLTQPWLESKFVISWEPSMGLWVRASANSQLVVPSPQIQCDPQGHTLSLPTHRHCSSFLFFHTIIWNLIHIPTCFHGWSSPHQMMMLLCVGSAKDHLVFPRATQKHRSPVSDDTELIIHHSAACWILWIKIWSMENSWFIEFPVSFISWRHKRECRGCLLHRECCCKVALDRCKFAQNNYSLRECSRHSVTHQPLTAEAWWVQSLLPVSLFS